MRQSSPLAGARRAFQLKEPAALEGMKSLDWRSAAHSEVDPAVQKLFPRTASGESFSLAKAEPYNGAPPKVGVVLSGGQAPGGHNVIAGLYRGLKQLDANSELLGFLGGPIGLLEDRHLQIQEDQVEAFLNSGGFDWLGSGRDKIETETQIQTTIAVCDKHQLDGLVIIGGDDSNTNAAILEEAFRGTDLKTRVVGVPKTIDGDLKTDQIETSFGFDTATKVYSELIGNIATDSRSAGKYWHFIKLMGRSASHVTLECALATAPNVAWIGEDIQHRNLTFSEIVQTTANAILERSKLGQNYGICLIPEGLIEFIPEMRLLLDEINSIFAEHSATIDPLPLGERAKEIRQRLPKQNATTFESIPESIRQQLVADRDSHGNLQVSLIQTDQLLVQAVKERLKSLGFTAFKAHTHFFGYEGRCAFPSNFDAEYTWALGKLAALCVARQRGGVMVALQNLTQPTEQWVPAAVSLSSLLHLEVRKGKPKPVIEKALVDLNGLPFRSFMEQQEAWVTQDAYRIPGPIQYFGPTEIADARNFTLDLESESRRT